MSEESAQHAQSTTGLRARRSHPEAVPGGRPQPGAWISKARIAETRKLWSNYYGRPIDDREAKEILMNVRRLVLACVNAGKEQEL